MLWYTNPHISVDRLIFVLSGDRGLLTVCRLAHPEATEVSSESPTCFFTSRVQYKLWIIGTNTASSLLSSVGRAVDSLSMGHRFEPCRGHQTSTVKALITKAFLLVLRAFAPSFAPHFFMSNLSRYL